MILYIIDTTDNYTWVYNVLTGHLIDWTGNRIVYALAESRGRDS